MGITKIEIKENKLWKVWELARSNWGYGCVGIWGFDVNCIGCSGVTKGSERIRMHWSNSKCKTSSCV